MVKLVEGLLIFWKIGLTKSLRLLKLFFDNNFCVCM